MMRRSPRASEDSPGGEVEELMKRMAALRDLTNGADCTDEDKARHFLDMNRESSASKCVWATAIQSDSDCDELMYEM